MISKTMPAHDGADTVDDIEWDDGSARLIDGVFETDETGLRVPVVAGPNGRFDLFGGGNAAVAPDQVQLHARERSRSARLEVVNMTECIDDDFIARSALTAKRKMIAHDAGRRKQRGVHPQYLSLPLFKLTRRRVFAEHVIANVGTVHGTPHGAGRACYGDASEVNNCFHTHPIWVMRP